MSLTISQPSATELGFRSIANIHDFAPRVSLPPPRLSPIPRVDSPVTSLPASTHPSESKMSTPHRGLPPPSAMALPEPTRSGPPILGASLSAMPAPPAQWPGQEESMRSWLFAKAEEDKRKQEEEKTRQESLRLEQRRIEQAILRDSLQGGIPPNLIPMMYAGIGGANLASLSMELIQQYTGQLQAAQQQAPYRASPDLHRETRMIGPGPALYPQPQPQPQPMPQPPPPSLHGPPQSVLPSQPAEPPPSSHLQTTFAVYQPPPGHAAPTSAPRPPTHAQLPRLTTNEASVLHPPAAPAAAPVPGSGLADAQSSSASQFFIHQWVPPSESKPARETHPSTPAGKGGDGHHTHTSSLMSEPDYRESPPRKRKAQGGHQPNPPPTTSPSFSTGSSGSGRKSGRMRSHSNTSRPDLDSRPGSSRQEPSSGGDARAQQPQPTIPSHGPARRPSDDLRRPSPPRRSPPRRRSVSRSRHTPKQRSVTDATLDPQQDRSGHS